MHVAKEEGLIVTTVRDFGIVIPESEWENVFEKFYRASSHGEKEGSGLGLVVAKNIVSRHGGHIFVRSDEKNGTIFTNFQKLLKIFLDIFRCFQYTNSIKKRTSPGVFDTF
jgi:signal transduction histidine kinase